MIGKEYVHVHGLYIESLAPLLVQDEIFNPFFRMD
jgi:hypothetical protein